MKNGERLTPPFSSKGRVGEQASYSRRRTDSISVISFWAILVLFMAVIWNIRQM
jgi:hypothetical protein